MSGSPLLSFLRLWGVVEEEEGGGEWEEEDRGLERWCLGLVELSITQDLIGSISWAMGEGVEQSWRGKWQGFRTRAVRAGSFTTI